MPEQTAGDTDTRASRSSSRHIVESGIEVHGVRSKNPKLKGVEWNSPMVCFHPLEGPSVRSSGSLLAGVSVLYGLACSGTLGSVSTAFPPFTRIISRLSMCSLCMYPPSGTKRNLGVTHCLILPMAHLSTPESHQGHVSVQKRQP